MDDGSTYIQLGFESVRHGLSRMAGFVVFDCPTCAVDDIRLVFDTSNVPVDKCNENMMVVADVSISQRCSNMFEQDALFVRQLEQQDSVRVFVSQWFEFPRSRALVYNQIMVVQSCARGKSLPGARLESQVKWQQSLVDFRTFVLVHILFQLIR